MIRRWDIFPTTVLKTGLFETLHNYLYGIFARKLFFAKTIVCGKQCWQICANVALLPLTELSGHYCHIFIYPWQNISHSVKQKKLSKFDQEKRNTSIKKCKY